MSIVKFKEKNPVLDLSPKERKAYRERFRYWKSKNYSDDAAHKKAIEKFSMTENEPEILEVTPKRQTTEQATERLSEGAESMADNRQVTVFASDFFCLVVCLLFIGLATYLLIISSADVFGTGFIGYLKAGLLEIGIIVFSVIPVSNRKSAFIIRATLLLMIGLSLSVLFTAVEIDESDRKTEKTNSNIELKNLLSTREMLTENHDRLPGNYISKRQILIEQIADIDRQISEKIQVLKETTEISVIERQGKTECVYRFILILMNLVFAHLAFAIASRCLRYFRLSR